MSKPTIVVNRNTPFVVEVFSHIGNVVALDTAKVTREAVRDADILIVRSETKVDASLLEGSAVKFVGTVTIGTDHIDLDYLQSRGIAFASAPGSNANSVAEYVAAALLVWARRNGTLLQRKSIGIVGVGNVGSKVVRVAKALGIVPVLNDPPLKRTTGDASFVSLDELMDCDFLTLHLPLTRTGRDATHHLFDERRLAALKKGSVLINTSRGGVVDTRALSSAVAVGHLSAAILDVWEHEPDIDINLLQQVFLGTAHIAGYSLDGKLNALRIVYEEVCRYFGFDPLWRVDASALVETPRVSVPADVFTPQDALDLVVRRVYDIEYDDMQLREIIQLPESLRGRYFMKLRAGYRIRREFYNTVVELSAHHTSIGKTLEELGFKTLIKQEVRS
jgi:erythronate-4-phosphate dehydrogenase